MKVGFSKYRIYFLLWLLTSGQLLASQGSGHFALSEQEFLGEVFDGDAPTIKRVWIRGELKKQVEGILQHPVKYLRVKYWQSTNKSVWVIDEIGKEKPITIGVSLAYLHEVSSIDNIRVLAYRESRGWEVKHGFFTDQFSGLSLQRKKNKFKLSDSIDGISGATLSVRALKKVAQIALLLDEHVRSEEQ